MRIARPLLALAAPLFWAGSAPANICAPDLPRYRPQLLAFPANAPYTTADGRIRIVGYNDMAEMLTALGRIFERAHPGFHFDLVLRGTRTAPSALTDGTSLFAPMGAEFEDKDLAAYQRVYGEQPLLIRIAHDSLNPLAKSSPVGIFVHSTNPLSTLSIENARRIFTRSDNSARHWADLGLNGASGGKRIRPVGFGNETAIGQFLRRHKFGGAPFVRHYQGLPQSRAVIVQVAQDPLAIGLANLNHAIPGVKALGVSERNGGRAYYGSAADIRSGFYPLDRHLLVYVRRARGNRIDPVARAWIDLILSCEGQQAIANGALGYIPLNAREIAQERQKLAGF